MKANYHTHTWRCNHAEPDEEQFVRCAIARGLSVLGFSDHTPYLFSDGYVSGIRMTVAQLPEYIQTVETLRDQYAHQIDIRLGLEAEYYPDHFPALQALLRDTPMEYLILGQHFLGNEVGNAYAGSPTADADILRQYCRQSMDAMNTGSFSYFAHPDLINYLGSPDTYRHWMRQLCMEANQCGLPLEYNLLGVQTGRHYPNPQLWELAAECGNEVVLGIDAHLTRLLADKTAEEKTLTYLASLGITPLETVTLRKI